MPVSTSRVSRRRPRTRRTARRRPARQDLQTLARRAARRSLAGRTGGRLLYLRAPGPPVGDQYIPVDPGSFALFDPDLHERVSQHPNPLVMRHIQRAPLFGWTIGRRRTNQVFRKAPQVFPDRKRKRGPPKTGPGGYHVPYLR